MMDEIFFQVYDEAGTPMGGHVFRAPDRASLEASVAAYHWPAGWTKTEVASLDDIVNPPHAEE